METLFFIARTEREWHLLSSRRCGLFDPLHRADFSLITKATDVKLSLIYSEVFTFKIMGLVL